MLRETISHHIELIYPAGDAHALSEKICAAFGLAPDTPAPNTPAGMRGAPALPWSEADSFLITYGDTILSDTRRPLLNTLDFLQGHLDGVVNGVHILPFFPFTSDDGFAVSDYENVRPDLGDWDD
ncbi:MAG TPA: alpha-amylase, partial [Rhodobiaceae bacterium]|nr:alpha-amylase [Rhodobiaceae bacterium]